MTKSKIYEAELVIYPRIIWITYGWKTKDVEKEFEPAKGYTFSEDDDGAAATTYQRVVKLSTNKYGILINFASKAGMTISAIAHEAFHAADDLCDELGMCNSENTGNEHIAYLVGHIADLIYQVKTNKFK